MRKKLLSGTLLVGFLGVLIIIQYFKYPIKSDNSNLEYKVLAFLNDRKDSYEDVQILGYFDLNKNMRYVSILLDGRLGEVRLIKGPNNNFKVESVGHGSGDFRYRLVEGDNQQEKYLVFSGKNIDLGIKEIQISFDDKYYRVDIPNTDYFMVHFEVDQTLTMFDGHRIAFYDDEGKDITQNIER